MVSIDDIVTRCSYRVYWPIMRTTARRLPDHALGGQHMSTSFRYLGILFPFLIDARPQQSVSATTYKQISSNAQANYYPQPKCLARHYTELTAFSLAILTVLCTFYHYIIA